MKENFLINLQKTYGLSKKTVTILQKKVGLNTRKMPRLVKSSQKNFIIKFNKNKELGRSLKFKKNEILKFNKKINKIDKHKKNVKNYK